MKILLMLLYNVLYMDVIICMLVYIINVREEMWCDVSNIKVKVFRINMYNLVCC